MGRSRTSQFQDPTGIAGRIAGRLMAVTNGGMNRFALEMLHPGRADAVLEIGYGPGTMIALLARNAPAGFVAGVDPSATMLAQARARNRAAVREGRVELKLGSVSAIPYGDARFDAAVSVNTIYFWPDGPIDVREVRRVLKPGGMLVLTFRVQQTEDGHARLRMVSGPLPVSEVERWLRDAGFHDIRREVRRITPFTAATIVAHAR
ncbi:MAG: methyltransferase domain-containing protein [Chloroflexi bacterium]|nr:methyltransferase domain-containing protein [Chloroflexota bacterium]